MSTLCYVAANSFSAGNGIAKIAERASGGIHQLRGLTKIEREDASDSPSLGFYFSFSASGLLCLVPTERPYFPRPNSALVQNEQIYYHREPETAAKWRKW